MTVTRELLEVIKTALESVQYGSVEVLLAEKGEFIEIHVKDKIRVEKDRVHIPYSRG